MLEKEYIIKFKLYNFYRINSRSEQGFTQNFLTLLVPIFTKECSDVAHAWSTTLTLLATTPSCLARAPQTSQSATTVFVSSSAPSTQLRRLKVPNLISPFLLYLCTLQLFGRKQSIAALDCTQVYACRFTYIHINILFTYVNMQQTFYLSLCRQIQCKTFLFEHRCSSPFDTFFLKYMKFLDVTPHPMDYSCSRSDLLVRYYTIKPYTKEFHLLSIQAPNYVI